MNLYQAMHLYGESKAVLEELRKQSTEAQPAPVEKLGVVGQWTLWDVVVRHVGAYHGASCPEWLSDLSELARYFEFKHVMTDATVGALADKPRLVRLLKHWGMVRVVSEQPAGLYDGLQAYERELAEEADDAA